MYFIAWLDAYAAALHGANTMPAALWQTSRAASILTLRGVRRAARPQPEEQTSSIPALEAAGPRDVVHVDLAEDLAALGDLGAHWQDIAGRRVATTIRPTLRVVAPTTNAPGLSQRVDDVVRIWELCATVTTGAADVVRTSSAAHSAACVQSVRAVDIVDPDAARPPREASYAERWSAIRRTVAKPASYPVHAAFAELSTATRAVTRLDALVTQIRRLNEDMTRTLSCRAERCGECIPCRRRSSRGALPLAWQQATQDLALAMIDWRLAAHTVVHNPDPFRWSAALTDVSEAALHWGNMVACHAFRTKGGVFEGHGMHLYAMMTSAADAVAETLRENLGWAGIVPIKRSEDDRPRRPWGVA